MFAPGRSCGIGVESSWARHASRGMHSGDTADN
jgi:hypothetical protein